MPGPLISIGGVGIDVIPNAQGLYARLAPQVLPDANRIADQAGREMGRRIQSGISDGMRDGIRSGGRAATAQATREGSQAGGAFGRAMRTRLEAALRALPDIRIGASTSEADADIQALRVRLQTLTNQRIGIDLDAAAARAEAADIEEQLRRLGAAHPNVQMRVDTAAARAALAEFRAELDRVGRTSVSPRIQVDGGFAQRLRAAVEAAQAQLPDITIDASTSTASAQLQALRGQLESLRTVRVGIDLDAATALARIADIQRRLDQLAAGDATADVRVDAATASATLATVQAQVDALDGDTARIDVDVSAAAAGLVRLTTLAAGVGPAIVPAIAGLTFGVGALASVLSTATIGAGAFAAAATPGLIGVGKAVQATTAAQDALAAAQDKTTRGAAAQGIAAQQQALSLAGAQASLASAQRSAAQTVADAQERVKDAIEGVADAQDQAARRMDQALERITAASRQHEDALRDQERAQKDLAEAQKAAAQQAEEIAARQAGGALAERSAVIAVEKAQKDLDEVKKSGAAADSLAFREAQLAYDEAVQRLKDQRRENKQLADESKQTSRGVLQAEESLANAKRRTADASKAKADAEEEARRTQVEGAKAVAKAQDKVADAERAVARARAQAAEQVASAQRAVQAAQLASAAAAAQQTEAMTSANTALDKQKRLLADLTPEQRGVYDAVIRLKDGFKAWGDELAPATMPLVTRFLDGITRSLPALTPLVLAAADGFDRLFDRAGRALQDPFWDRFKENLVANIPRAIESMGVTFGNIFAGMAGVINAFLPQADAIADSMEGATASFREWGQNLETSEGFASFRAFLREDWPGVREAMADVGGALWQITRALAEISPSAVLILQGVGTAIENTPVFILQTLVDLFVAYRVALFAMAGAQVLYVTAMKGYVLITSLATASTWSLTTAMRVLTSANFILFLLTIITTFTLLMIQSESFRNKVVGVLKEVGSWFVWLYDKAVKPAVDGIVSAAVWLYDKGIRPAFDGISTAVMAVGSAAMWLWDKAIRPAFEAISLAARILTAVIVTVLVAPIVIAFNIWSAVALALWENAIKPVFEAIGELATWLWDNVLKPVVGYIGDSLRGWGIIATWLWEEAIKPALDGIGKALGWLWDNIIKPVVNAIGESLKGWGLIAQWLWNEAIKPAFDAIGKGANWLWDNGLKPPLQAAKDGFKQLGEWAQKLHDDWIKPWFDRIVNTVAGAMAAFVGAFSGAKNFLGVVWDGVKGVAAKPINWIIDVVYTRGIKKVWDAIASKVGLGDLPDAPRIDGYATGGIYPGYTPGRDIGYIGVSGGEAIIRPEGTRALGAGWVHGLNAASRAGGVQGAREFLAGPGKGQGGPYVGGFAFGGIVDSLTDALGDLKEKTKNLVRGAAAKVVQGLLAPIRAVVNLAPDSPDWALAAKRMPLKLMDGIVDKVKGDDAKWASMSTAVGLEWAKTQAGKAYQWGGSGNPSWDCSGFMAAIAEVISGRSPRRLWTTFDFVGHNAPANWEFNRDAPFRIGVTNAGVGHMAGTVLGINVESRGGDGVVVGPSARGWNHPMFVDNYGYLPSLGAHALGGIVPTRTYDSGGPLPPGLTLAYNGTGRTEQVYTADSNRALRSLAARGAVTSVRSGGAGAAVPPVHIDTYNQYANQTPRQVAEEWAVLQRSRGPR